MWAHVLKMLEQAEKLQRQYFQLRKSNQNGPTWEPPVDIFETNDKLFISVALPGVEAGDIQVVVDNDTLAIIGERPLAVDVNAVIRHMEIPYGRFERRINLRNGRFEIRENSLQNGCLKLILRKI
jgi:HSP20 family molecular chaperone IbpA